MKRAASAILHNVIGPVLFLLAMPVLAVAFAIGFPFWAAKQGYDAWRDGWVPPED